MGHLSESPSQLSYPSAAPTHRPQLCNNPRYTITKKVWDSPTSRLLCIDSVDFYVRTTYADMSYDLITNFRRWMEPEKIGWKEEDSRMERCRSVRARHNNPVSTVPLDGTYLIWNVASQGCQRQGTSLLNTQWSGKGRLGGMRKRERIRLLLLLLLLLLLPPLLLPLLSAAPIVVAAASEIVAPCSRSAN